MDNIETKVEIDEHDLNDIEEEELNAKKKYFNCPYNCGKIIKKIDNMRNHVKSIHKRELSNQDLKQSMTTFNDNVKSRSVTRFQPIINLENCKLAIKGNCQYCCYQSNNPHSLERHVNVQHEMRYWFQCPDCEFVCPAGVSVIRHGSIVHGKRYPTSINTLKPYLIRDQKRIHELRIEFIEKKLKKKEGKIIKKKERMFKTKEVNESTIPKFMPIDVSNFKPFLNVGEKHKNCQYCSFQSKSKHVMDCHVNVQHELKYWFQCPDCEYVCLVGRSVQHHGSMIHGKVYPTSINSLKSYLVRDQERIKELRIKMIEKKLKKEEKEEDIMEIEAIEIHDNSKEDNFEELLIK